MQVLTEGQMEAIHNYNRLDRQYRERNELQEGLKGMKQAMLQVLNQEVTHQADMERLDQAIPGMTRRFSKAMGLSEAEFSEQLQQGVVLALSLKEVLRKLLADPFLNG